MVEERNKKLKQKIHLRETKTILILRDPDVKSYLESLHKRFVVVTIDKAENNFVFI